MTPSNLQIIEEKKMKHHYFYFRQTSTATHAITIHLVNRMRNVHSRCSLQYIDIDRLTYLIIEGRIIIRLKTIKRYYNSLNAIQY